jgi:predicted alternative tryptophan synthase beta-subunit
MSLIEQEMSTDRWIKIPEEVRDIYRLWRPSPLYRARSTETLISQLMTIISQEKWWIREILTRLFVSRSQDCQKYDV